MKPTYDELFELVHQLREENRQLKERIQKLEECLGLNSQNSSKPPSSDQKKNKQKPKGGAVKGHQGHHRKRVEEVDKRIFFLLISVSIVGVKL